MSTDVIRDAEAKLKGVPGIQAEVAQNRISIPAAGPDGFEVGLVAGEGHYDVYFNGWHEEFEDAKSALALFLSGLSGECRLKEVRRGGRPHFWTVEKCEVDGWVPGWSVGLFVFPFWRKKEVVYLRNTVLPSAAT